MITARQFVEQAKSPNYDGIPYERLDCQAFVEQVMKDLDALPTNWRGSNHMWRDAVFNREKIVNSELVPAGAWVFTVKSDGKEREKGYYDGLGNAVHVGIYLGNNKVRHSTAGGVQYSEIWDKRWTHFALCKYIDYSEPELKEHYIQDSSTPLENRIVRKKIKLSILKDIDNVLYINIGDLENNEAITLLKEAIKEIEKGAGYNG